MSMLQLVYATNLISRATPAVQQRLSFMLRVANLAYAKQVEVHWAGEDGVWQVLPARYQRAADAESEYWLAETRVELSATQSLPGNIEFAVCYQVNGKTYWATHRGENYRSEADSGIYAPHSENILNLSAHQVLDDQSSAIEIRVAVARSLKTQAVVLHWSDDGWQTVKTTSCAFNLDYWNRDFASNARNPNQYGYAVWTAQLPTESAFKIEYCIECVTTDKSVWDNSNGANYFVSRPPLKLLILNLHCYQEENQDEKFSQIARAIDDLNIDIVCLQEVAELWNDGAGDAKHNAAYLINSRLRKPYHRVMDASHLGFDRYKEGIAILSRYPFEKHAARYVSSSEDFYNIHARKVMLGQVNVPYFGVLNVYSAHLSWWSDGFAEQFDALRAWAAAEHQSTVAASLLCGDFNIKAGSKGYAWVVASKEYDDQYLAVTRPPLFEHIFRKGGSHWQHALNEDGRIDYSFVRRGSRLRAVAAQTLFTEADYGWVSDHCGYLFSFEPLPARSDAQKSRA